MKWEVLVGALSNALGNGETEPNELIWTIVEDVAESPREEEAMSGGLMGLEDLEGVESQDLVSFWWDGGGAPISSYLSLKAIRLGDEWFVYFLSDDFPTTIVDRLSVLDHETATSAVERICTAEKYVNTGYKPSIDVGDLVDKGRIEPLFSDECE